MAPLDEIAPVSIPAAKLTRSGVWQQVVLRYVWFPLAYLIFGAVGLLTSLIGLGLAYLLPLRVRQPVGQRMIQELFAFFVWYLEWTGLAHFDFHDLAKLRHWRGGIIVANHPCLLDVVFLVSRLPRVFCLMKQGIISNLILCGTARLAGYVDNHSARGMVERCTNRIQAGETLVIFPEGSRTVQLGVNSFKMGFALVAQLSSAPIQTVFIEADSSFLGKHRPFFKPPATFPLHYSLKLGQSFSPRRELEARVLGQIVENCFRANLSPAILPSK